MKRKLIGIFIMTLLIGTTVLPVMGTLNKPENLETTQIGGPELEWMFSAGGSNHDYFNCVYETEDGGFIAAMATEDPEDVFSAGVFKLDKFGNEEWRAIETEIQGTGIYDFGISEVQQTHDGGYVVLGTCDRIEDLKYGFLWKLTADGETEWFNSAYSSQISSKWYVVVPWEVFPVVNGYLMAGGAWYLDDYFANDIDAILIKTDLNGDIEWRQVYRYGDWYDEISALCPTLDGGYILAGSVNFFGYEVITGPDDCDVWLIKVDAEGNIQWEQTYGGPENDWTWSKDIFQTSDGGYILNAQTSSYNVKNPTYDSNVWMLKVDNDGNELWNKTYGEYDQQDTTAGMDITSDGGFIFAAHKNHHGLNIPRDSMWLVKLDELGNVDWSQTWGGDKTERTYAVCQVSDGGFVNAGASSSYSEGGDWDGYILKWEAFDNNRPSKPGKPEGDSRGDPNTEYTFKCSATDPDGDDLYYQWQWGDGEYSTWIGPFSSGVKSEATYEWEDEDQYEIRVKVKDANGGESDWSDPLPFSTPKTKYTNLYQLILWRFIERYPLLEHLL